MLEEMSSGRICLIGGYNLKDNMFDQRMSYRMTCITEGMS